MIKTPNEQQRRSFGSRSASVEREEADGTYTLLAMDHYVTDEIEQFFESINAPGKYHLGYCDDNDGRIIAQKVLK